MTALSWIAQSLLPPRKNV